MDVETRHESLRLAAERLRNAAATHQPCAPVRDLILDGSVEDAYTVQLLNNEEAISRGARLIGWKIGLTNPAVQKQLGVDQPDFGAIFAQDEFGDSQPIPRTRLLQARAEAEIAVVLESDLDMAPVTVTDVVRAIGFVMPAIEVVDSRVQDWDITIVDTVADRASAGLHVLGPQRIPLDNLDLRSMRMVMTADGNVVSEGSGADCLGHPINAVVWLANTLGRLGQPLSGGDLILTGALGPMFGLDGVSHLEATIEGLGSVRATFV